MDASVIVRKARDSTGLTVRAFADLVGISPSTQSRIENGHLDPTVGMFSKILDAADAELSVKVPERKRTPSMDALRQHGAELNRLAATFGLENLRVFGSVAEGTANHMSDYDLLADATPGTGLFEVEGFRQAAEGLLGASVDLVTSGALSDDFRPSGQVPVPS